MTRPLGFSNPPHPAVKWLSTRVSLVRRAVQKDDLLHHGGVMAAATVVSGGFNYLYQVFMGRALGPEAFGVFGALFALFYLVSVLGRGIRFSVSRFVAEHNPESPALTRLYRGFLGRTLTVGAIVFGSIALAAHHIDRFLDVGSTHPVLIVALAAPASLAFTANKGALQGLQWFTTLGSYEILLAIIKFGLGVGLVILGYGVSGALGAIVLATIVVVAASTIHITVTVPRSTHSLPAPDYTQTYQYALPAVLAGFCLTVPGTIDVIMAQHFAPGPAAGRYTAVSVLGKILVFLPLGICAAFFPKVSEGYINANPDRVTTLLQRALTYAGAIAGTGALLYAIAPATVLSVFYGSAYTPAATLLRWYGLAIFTFVLAFVVLNFELARDRTRYVYVFAFGSVIEIGLLWLTNGSLVGMAHVLLLVNTGLFGVGLYEVTR